MSKVSKIQKGDRVRWLYGGDRYWEVVDPHALTGSHLEVTRKDAPACVILYSDVLEVVPRPDWPRSRQSNNGKVLR